MYSTNILLNLISTIFKTINSSVDDTRKTLALFNKDWNTYKTNWQNANGFWGKVGSVFGPSKSTSVPPQQLQILRNWNNAVKHGCTNQETFNRIIADADDKTKLYFAGLNKGKGSVEGLKNAQNVAKASTVGLTIAQTALNVAISMGIGILINLAITGITKLVNANKEAIESANELREKYADFKETNASNISTLKGLKDEFTELSKGVSQYGDNISLTTEQYDRYREIIQQIVGISPSLSEGYSTENGHIADKNGLLERAIELQEIEYRNELRKITNLDSLKTSMSGFIAEYKEALNGGILTAEGNIIGTTIDTDFRNSLWQLFNTNNREGFNAEDMAKQIMEFLGVADVEKELKKYYNEYGYWQDSWFWNDYVNTIAGNLDAVTGSLTYEDVGLDENTFDQNLEKLESYSESYRDMLDSVKLANEAIQTDLGYIAEYADGYSDLSTEQQKFVADFLKGFDINDIASENAMGTLSYDNDKMASVKSQIKKFVEELSKDTETKDALSKLYAIPTDSQSVGDFVSQFRSALDTVRDYCGENGIEIPLGISESETEINELEAQYNRVVEYVKGKFDGYDFSDFFKTKSINSKEELDKFLEIAQGANTATEAMEKYVQSSTSLDKMTVSLETFNKEMDKIQDGYAAVQSAIDEYNEKGYLSIDATQKLLELDDELLATMVDENGQINLNTLSFEDLARAKLENLKASATEALTTWISKLEEEGATADELAAKYVKVAVAKDLANGEVATGYTDREGNWVDITNTPEYKAYLAKTKAIEAAISGIGKGGLSGGGKNPEKERLEKAQDYAEKVADIQEDLAEKEKQFAENMAEAWVEEHLEQLKDGLEKQKDIIDRYKKNVEVIDFGLEHIEEDDFANRADLLSDKLDALKSYGAEMRAEFDRIANTIPKTGDEAVELANRIEELGSEMRDNVSAIRETVTALQMLNIDAASALIDNRMDELQSKLDDTDRLIEILNSDYKDNYKYTSEILSMDMLLPVYSEFDKKRREKQRSDRELIKTEQETQDKINEIVSKSLEMQAKQNAEARAKERKKLIEDMEKARKEAEKKLAEAHQDYLDFLEKNKLKTSNTVNDITKMFNDMDIKLPEVDISSVDDAVTKIKEKLKEVFNFDDAPPGIDLTGVDKSTYGFINPTKGGSISSGYGPRGQFMTASGELSSSNHQAIDIRGKLGDNIYAIADGTVLLSDYVKGYGYTIEIQHADGYVSKYHHMNSKSTLNKGDKVKQGTVIGYIGMTGNSTGPHLDFQITKNGVLVNPTGYIPGYAVGTPKGNSLAANLGIAGENYKPEILIDKATGKATYIDTPTIIDTTKTDVVGEKATAEMPKFADGTIHRKVTDGTGVTAEDIDKLIEKYCGENSVLKPGMGIYFIEAQNSSGIDALTLFAIAAHESSYGTSQIAKDKSNLFGYGAYDADPLNMAYNYGDASNPENLRNGIMTISNLIGKWYVDKRGQDTLYEIEHDPNKTGFKYASDTQWDEKVASYVDKFAKDLEIDLGESVPFTQEGSASGITDPSKVEHSAEAAEKFYTDASSAIGKIEKDFILGQQEIINNKDLSDYDKTVKLLESKAKYSEDAAKAGVEIYNNLIAAYKSWIDDVNAGKAEWSLEIYEAYKDTIADVSDLVFGMEQQVVEAKQEAANYEWENSNNWINERNEKGDWDNYGHFDANGEWIQDSETQAWGRVVEWLKEKYPEEREKIAEAEHKQVEAQLKETTDWINERNEKGDWAEGDSEAKAWQRYLDWLKEYHPDELGERKAAEKKIFDAEAKEFTDWIDKRNEKGDWDNYGHFDANGEWIQDSEVQSWQRYIDWLEEFHPEEVNKIAEAKSKQVEAQLKETTDWIDERNKKGDWAEGDSEVKAWERYLEWLKTNYPNELGKIKEAEEKIYDSRRKEMEEAISDIDDYIAARNLYDDWDAYGDSELKAVQRQTEIIKDAYEQRLLSAEEYVDRLEDISQKIYTLGQNEVDKHLSNIDSYISARNFYNDWDVSGDSEIKAINRQLQILDEAYRLNLLSFEEYTEKSAEYTQKLYSVAKENIIETVSEIIEDYEELKQDEIDALNFKSSQKDSLKSLLQSYYDVTNAITDAQHEIDKELRASQSMYEYLNEETRELLFNQEDYNALNKELLDIQSSANELQNQYKKDILGASEETIAEITSQYQMQYETMMKQYEIAKAELDVAKKRQKLDNVLAERNVRMFVNGQWQWVANTQDVIDAQNELADAENEKKKAETSLNQTNSINELTTAQDAIATQINYLEADLEEVRNYWADMQELLNGESDEVASALRQISKVTSPELKRVLDVTGIDVEGFSSIVSESTTTLSDIINGDTGLNSVSTNISDIVTDLQNFSKAIQTLTDEINGVDVKNSGQNGNGFIRDTIAKMKANSEKWYTASKEERDDLHELNQQLGDSIDADYDETTGKWYSSDGKLLYSTSSKDSSSSGGSSSGTSGGGSSSSSKNKNNATATIPGVGTVGVKVNSSGKTTTTGLPVGTIVHTAGGDYRITGGTGGNYTSVKIDEKHADGTRYTPGGLTALGEEGFEAFITNNGRLIPIAQPTIGNVGAGGIVFNREQMANLRNLWDLSNIGKISPFVSSSSMSKQNTTIDNSIHINGLTVSEQGNEDWINGLRRYVATHK